MTITGGAAKKRSTRSKAKARKPAKKTVRKATKKTTKKKTTKPVTMEQLKKKAKRLGITLSKNGVAKKKLALQRAIAAKR